MKQKCEDGFVRGFSYDPRFKWKLPTTPDIPSNGFLNHQIEVRPSGLDRVWEESLQRTSSFFVSALCPAWAKANSWQPPFMIPFLSSILIGPKKILVPRTSMLRGLIICCYLIGSFLIFVQSCKVLTIVEISITNVLIFSGHK